MLDGWEKKKKDSERKLRLHRHGYVNGGLQRGMVGNAVGIIRVGFNHQRRQRAVSAESVVRTVARVTILVSFLEMPTEFPGSVK